MALKPCLYLSWRDRLIDKRTAISAHRTGESLSATEVLRMPLNLGGGGTWESPGELNRIADLNRLCTNGTKGTTGDVPVVRQEGGEWVPNTKSVASRSRGRECGATLTWPGWVGKECVRRQEIEKTALLLRVW